MTKPTARSFTSAAVVRAIARAASRPNQPLPFPRRIDLPPQVGPDAEQVEDWPLALANLGTGQLAGVAAWCAVLDEPHIVVVTGDWDTTVTAFGRLLSGPVVGIYDTVGDWPLDSVPGTREITAEELAAVAKAALIPADELADMLAGAS